MATLTYVFDEDTPPSHKDTIVSEKASEKNLTVHEVPDVYPGLAGELEISGRPGELRELLDYAADTGAPGHPVRVQFTTEEAEEVTDLFDDFKLDLETVS